MMIGMALFWVALILGLIWLVRGTVERQQEPPPDTALTILDRRFAEGAISIDEYHERRGVLADAAAPLHRDSPSTAIYRDR
jgi:uncharacterized membrane protein